MMSLKVNVSIVAGLGMITFVVVAQPPPPELVSQLNAGGLHLADLRNYSYTIVFPTPKGEVRYSGKSEYLYSTISPSGRSLFAIRREFNERGIPLDSLVRRELKTTGPGPEEVIASPFDNITQCAVSFNENVIAIAGRLRGGTKDRRDGVFLYSRVSGNVQYLAPFNNLTEDIRSLNVSDRGDLLLYEDKGTVMLFKGPIGHLVASEQHPGKLPVLLPDGSGYIYFDRGQLILNEGNATRELLSVPNLVGAIRVSSDAQFVAFGVDLFGNLASTQLRICQLKTLGCIDGPKYSDWIAGKETFWIKGW
jgi:hypothetical protein